MTTFKVKHATSQQRTDRYWSGEMDWAGTRLNYNFHFHIATSRTRSNDMVWLYCSFFKRREGQPFSSPHCLSPHLLAGWRRGNLWMYLLIYSSISWLSLQVADRLLGVENLFENRFSVASCFMCACKRGHVDLVQRLLKAGLHFCSFQDDILCHLPDKLCI